MMKVLALIVCVLCVGSDAKPGLLAPVLLTSSQYHTQDQLGQYAYGYSNPQSAKAEVKTADGITQGSYSYVDAEGKLQSVHYTSDEVNGFRVAATNLPAAPSLLPSSLVVQQDAIEVAAKKIQENKLEDTITTNSEEQQQQDDNLARNSAEETQPAIRTTLIHSTHHQVHHPVLRTSLLTYAAPAPLAVTHYAAPGFAYSYGYAYPHLTYLNHLTPIAYAAAPAPTAYVATAPQLQPVVPTETPEVAKARAEHIRAHEEAKARNL